jgi:hypothetical protein
MAEFFPRRTYSLDPEQLTKYRRYLAEYYNDEFRTGQGAEQILDTIDRYAGDGDWIDLGCGPSTLFWSLTMTGIRSVNCADISPEALTVLAEFVHSDEVPICYRQVLERYGRPPDHLATMRRRVQRYFVLDVTRPWPTELAGVAFDLVTAFGIFGLSPSPATYLDCFEHLRPQLRPGGRIIGGNWIRSQRLVDEDGHDNRYLSTELVGQGIRRAGAELLHCEQTPIQGDPYYDGVIVWAARAAES